jgi:hypothetical protein
MIIGAVLLVTGLIGIFYYGTMVLYSNQTSQGRLNPVTSGPYPVNGIDSFGC